MCQLIHGQLYYFHVRVVNPCDPFGVQADMGDRLSRDALEHLVRKHCLTAAGTCPSIGAKRVTPHTLRHSNAMDLLHHGVDPAVIALWLGHENVETTQIYLHADLRLKERALARTRPPATKPGRFRPSDSLLTFLEGL